MPNSIDFYSVKQKKTIRVPFKYVIRVAYQHKDNVTYALRALYEGEALTRFVTKKQYDSL